jgi:thiol-disulfide isomerase/thioredoxin
MSSHATLRLAIQRWRRRLATAAVAFAALTLGCSQPAAEDQPNVSVAPAGGGSTTGKRVESAATGGEAAPSIPIAAIDRAGLDQRIAELKGKVVLVDYWATWCAPCMEQLPHTLALARDREADGLAVATVCMEDPDEKAKAAKALAARGADENTPAEHFISQDGGGPAAMEAFAIPGGALPYYQVYDKQGKLRHEFALDPSAEKQFTSDDVSAAIEALLSE